MSTPSQTKAKFDVSVRPMQESDLPAASRLCRVAFGTLFGVPDPETFWEDREYISTRFPVNPGAALVAEVNGNVAGSIIALNWGSFGFLGPLTVDPQIWGHGIAQRLLAPTMDLFAQWGVREAGLFTFADSPKHAALYQKFGFWPRFLTAIMSKEVSDQQASSLEYSALGAPGRDEALDACRRLTDVLYEGLDVTTEIRSVNDQNLGDTILLWDGDSLDAFAVCHCGAGTEAGNDSCFVKFAAVRSGAGGEEVFGRLLNACEAFAAKRGLHRVDAGVSLSRRQAYRELLERGYRTQVQGVAMHRPDSPAYNRPEVFILDDWR